MTGIGLEQGFVKLVPYNPEWKSMYDDESRRLQSILRIYLIDIQHIGSTAIPGIFSKPIIDIAIAIRNLNEMDQIIDIMEKNGYLYRGEMGIPDRHLFVKSTGAIRTHHIHIMLKIHIQWETHQLFRDYLNHHTHIANQYNQLKMKLKDQFEHDRAGYTEGKSQFIQSVIEKAKKEKN